MCVYRYTTLVSAGILAQSRTIPYHRPISISVCHTDLYHHHPYIENTLPISSPSPSPSPLPPSHPELLARQWLAGDPQSLSFLCESVLESCCEQEMQHRHRLLFQKQGQPSPTWSIILFNTNSVKRHTHTRTHTHTQYTCYLVNYSQTTSLFIANG